MTSKTDVFASSKIKSFIILWNFRFVTISFWLEDTEADYDDEEDDDEEGDDDSWKDTCCWVCGDVLKLTFKIRWNIIGISII